MQQKNTKITLKNIHAINLFNNTVVTFLPKNDKHQPQQFIWNEIDKKVVENLFKELHKQPAVQSSRKSTTRNIETTTEKLPLGKGIKKAILTAKK
jgi:hypothetical protein